jgi:hypothetical protein
MWQTHNVCSCDWRPSKLYSRKMKPQKKKGIGEENDNDAALVC